VPAETPDRRLTISDLTGENRALTTRIAGWIRDSTLDDGSQPLGIRYTSKHGSDLPLYALWLRATDDGNPTAEPVKLVSTTTIERDNAYLQMAAALHGMTVW
jgi:hypothetical protein